MATFRVPVEPALLSWAIERSGVDPDEISAKAGLRDLPLWQSRQKQPTYKQLEKFAHATYAPFGFFFLDEPPVEELPIPDFRTLRNAALARPTPNLLETIFICEQRQEWYRNYARSNAQDPLPFVGSATTDSPVARVADEIRRALQFTTEDRSRDSSWTDALRRLIDTTEDAGILVMVSGIVGNNTKRPLNVEEFRGFALSDPYAPLIFVNGADTKAAQIFTLVHEVAHIWLGQTALTNAALDRESNNETELWCNKVAAEVLVPLAMLRVAYRGEPDEDELARLARMYKVSTLVVLRRLFDAGFLRWNDYRARYEEEHERVMEILANRTRTSGGNFYFTQPLRVSQRFAHAVVTDTLSGRTLHRDAYRLLGTRKHETFVHLGEQVGAV